MRGLMIVGLMLMLAGCARGHHLTWQQDAAGTLDAPMDLAQAPEVGSTRLDLSVPDHARLDGDGPRLSDGPTADRPRLDLVPWDGCIPDCTGKCAGASNGCGLPCPANQCPGCCSGQVCVPGTATDRCGSAGAACKDCTFSADCTLGACVSGACTTQSRPDGIVCPNGRCFGGMCCTGCWDGSSCRGGISGQYCGQKGAACGTCLTTDPCKTATCSSGYCVMGQRPFGWGCPSGKCLHGSCCTGCISSSACHPGNSSGNCGAGGGPCQQCWSPQYCNGSNCVK